MIVTTQELSEYLSVAPNTIVTVRRRDPEAPQPVSTLRRAGRPAYLWDTAHWDRYLERHEARGSRKLGTRPPMAYRSNAFADEDEEVYA